MNLKNYSFVSVLLFLGGCQVNQNALSPSYYALNTSEGKVDATVNLQNVQIGYRIKPRLTTFATAFFHQGSKRHLLGFGDESNEYHNKIFEANAGAAYVYEHNHFLYGLQAGAGFGKIHYTHIDFSGGITMNSLTFKPFMQSFICFQDHGQIIGLSGKLSYLEFTGPHIAPGVGYDKEDAYFLYHSHPSHLFADPSLFYRVGGEKIKLQGEVTTSLNLTNHPIRYQMFGVFLSLYYKF